MASSRASAFLSVAANRSLARAVAQHDLQFVDLEGLSPKKLPLAAYRLNGGCFGIARTGLLAIPVLAALPATVKAVSGRSAFRGSRRKSMEVAILNSRAALTGLRLLNLLMLNIFSFGFNLGREQVASLSVEWVLGPNEESKMPVLILRTVPAVVV
jgi:hypothetical protein